MNIVLSSAKQKNNTPSFIGLAQRLDNKDRQTKDAIKGINGEYNKNLSSQLYILEFYKTLEKVENDLMSIAKVWCGLSSVAPYWKDSFNYVLVEADASYITVPPFNL